MWTGASQPKHLTDTITLQLKNKLRFLKYHVLLYFIVKNDIEDKCKRNHLVANTLVFILVVPHVGSTYVDVFIIIIKPQL